MRRIFFCLLLLVLPATAVFAQDTPQTSDPVMASPRQQNPQVIPVKPEGAKDTLTIPVGTRIPVELEHAINTKSARDGDTIYCKTNFPVVIDGHIAIPPGTFVQGTIQHSQRAGRVKGKAELVMVFTTLIYPNGYTVMLPGSVGGMPGSSDGQMKKNGEGTIQGDGGKAKDAGTVAQTSAAGAGIGGLAGISSGHSGSGTLIGAGAGAVGGLASVLLTRGPDLHLNRGTMIEVQLERPITVDREKIKRAAD